VARTDDYRGALRNLPTGGWDAYLAEHSGLPGPRANLELAAAVAEECPAERLYGYADSNDEYRALCGAFGLGRLAAEGDRAALARLRRLATDARWRVREGVAMGLQRLGDTNPADLRRVVAAWADDPHPLVRRAAVAGVCEPRLLTDARSAHRALDVLDAVTEGLVRVPAAARRDVDVRTLRQALGYCWSVAVAALPVSGFDRLDRWAAVDDHDVRWVIRENLRRARLQRADPARYAMVAARVGD
jgi:HEAT repeat protein